MRGSSQPNRQQKIYQKLLQKKKKRISARSKKHLSTIKHNLAFQVPWSSLIPCGTSFRIAPMCRCFVCKAGVPAWKWCSQAQSSTSEDMYRAWQQFLCSCCTIRWRETYISQEEEVSLQKSTEPKLWIQWQRCGLLGGKNTDRQLLFTKI